MACFFVFLTKTSPCRYYKAFEKDYNALSTGFEAKDGRDIAAGRAVWKQIVGDRAVDPAKYVSSGQDMVEQLICGAGWRIVASASSDGTDSLLLSSVDTKGVNFVVTAKAKGASAESKASLNHFSAKHIDRYLKNHNGKQGVAVLGFRVVAAGGLDKILGAYRAKHPALVLNEGKAFEYTQGKGTLRIGEVFAYYASDKSGNADTGTVIRFVEAVGDCGEPPLLPGFRPCEAKFPVRSFPTYYDHWVSNVVHRKEFLQTLNDTLGFTPKVDFNAGVVAAGEAIIESTVTGNASRVLRDSKEALRSHEQVYLPINNALSTVGHVHLFLDQLGQGIQHCASRVEDIVTFIRTVNARREVTGRGFSFLRIPRSYYGRLTVDDMVAAGASRGLSEAVIPALQSAGLVNVSGIVDIDITEEAVGAAVAQNVSDAAVRAEYKGDAKTAVDTAVLRARYVNLTRLLKDHLSERTYLDIVRNKILVDIQGNDILFQIFTSSVLQREKTDEAPFLEFIQRVCSEKCGADGQPAPIRPGCGGFGIRNFLTLFLSIEVSKAMDAMEAAVEAKDNFTARLSEKRVQVLTAQLNVSNPVLTAISDSMTAEADLRLAAAACDDKAEKAKLLAEAEAFMKKKLDGNRRLQTISDQYKAKMAAIREEQAKGAQVKQS